MAWLNYPLSYNISCLVQYITLTHLRFVMHTITTSPEFANLTEDEISQRLDIYEEEDPDTETTDPIVQEVLRLIDAYNTRFEELSENGQEDLEEIINFAPQYIIEEIAFDIFMEALHDSLQDLDDE